MLRSERWISNALRGGVLLSAAVVLAGGAVLLARHGDEPGPDFRTFRGEQSDYRAVEGILRKAADGGGRGLIQLGVLLLIATPVLRVVLSLLLFLKHKDWTYVFVTLFVLAVLLYGLFFAPR